MSNVWTKRVLRAITLSAVFLGTLAAVAVAGFYALLILVGPHGGLLPDVFYLPLLALFWLSVIGLPAGLTWFTRRRLVRAAHVPRFGVGGPTTAPSPAGAAFPRRPDAGGARVRLLGSMQMTSSSFWDRWLVLVGWGLIVFGLLLTLLSGSRVFDLLFNRPVDAAFWSIRPDGIEPFRAWVYGVLGATLSGWATCIVFIARHPFRRRERWAWDCLCAGVTLWYVVDTACSIAFGVWFNVGLNSVVVVLVFAPLLATRGEFVARRSGPDESL